MHNRDKYPDLWALFEKLQAKRKELAAPVEELRAKRDALAAQLAPIEAEMRELTNAMKPHLPALAAVDNEIAAIAKAMGGKTIVN